MKKNEKKKKIRNMFPEEEGEVKVDNETLFRVVRRLVPVTWDWIDSTLCSWIKHSMIWLSYVCSNAKQRNTIKALNNMKLNYLKLLVLQIPGLQLISWQN